MEQQSNLLIGAWELVSGFYVGEDQVVTEYDVAGIKSMKVLAGHKFSFVSTVKDAFYAAGSGDYVAENGIYAEVPQLASFPGVGQRFEFQFQLEGDLWTNVRWQNGVCVEREVWKRLG